MTEEEKLAERYVNGIPMFAEEGEGFSRTQMQRAFLAGLKAGKPKWHDLRKDPNDLPEHYMDIVNQDGEKVMYDYSCKAWRYNDADEYFCDTPIAWCEVPKYTEE